MSDYPFKSEKLSPTIGLQIWGVDPSRPLSDAVIAALRHAWLDNLVIFLRDIEITPAQQLASPNVSAHRRPIPSSKASTVFRPSPRS